MKLFTFVSIAFVAFQVGVTANPIADPMPVPEDWWAKMVFKSLEWKYLEEDVRREEGIANLDKFKTQVRVRGSTLATDHGAHIAQCARLSLLVYRSAREVDVEGLVGEEVDLQGDTRSLHLVLTAEPVGQFNLGVARFRGKCA
ncbi:hypothetical protein C8R45DRAFT_927372 [Mycena sanguinolenta]|nr:hypothetical protein C8R45DRAFT_927372 [Mycena sanguinolenta]